MTAIAVRPVRTLSRLRPYLWFAPALIIVVAVSFWPLAHALVQSFHRSNYLDLGTFTGLSNFERFLLSEAGRARAWNSFVLVAGTLALAMPLGFVLALLLNLPLRGRNLIRTLLIVPWLVSNTVAALLWAWLLNAQFGPIADLTSRLGMTMPNLLTSSIWAMPALILCNAWGSYPLVMVFTLSALQTIPKEIHEAARMDGARRWQRFVSVTFPLVRNTTLVTVVLTTLHCFNGVTIVLIMTGGGPLDATDVMALRVFEEGFKFHRMGLASAGAVIIFAINVLFTVAYMRVLKNEHGA
ncbi:MAG: sugar ABC transporter permease [Alphaproteobacteria bacterium]|nr:sugar ABC transporter permease [Alphaproteobacteria bacterium]